jgi:hypothetical protein
MTDRQKILKWFKTRKYLTCMQAIHKLGVYNLRSRACEIAGITSEMIEVKRKDGLKVRVARYSLHNLTEINSINWVEGRVDTN